MYINSNKNVKEKLTVDREVQSRGVATKGYHTDNGIFNASYFMEELLKKHQKIRFSGYGASHKNRVAYCSINTLVMMIETILMHAALNILRTHCPLIFGQWQWIIMYGYTIGYLTCGL